MRRFRSTFIPAAVLALVLLPSFFPARAVETLPDRLSNSEFWKLSSTLSEPDGYFHSENFVSNERSFQHVLADLADRRANGSAYIGVGPEQNFHISSRSQAPHCIHRRHSTPESDPAPDVQGTL
jgi:hypothetical protein